MPAKPQAKPKPRVLDNSRCQFSTTDNRQCRMLRTPGHKTLCAMHAQQDLQLRGAETAARQLLSPLDDFRTVATINHSLGKLYFLLAHNRIPVRNAATLAYISQLLLQTLDPLRVEMRRALQGKEYCQFDISVKHVHEETNSRVMEQYDELHPDEDEDEDDSEESDDVEEDKDKSPEEKLDEKPAASS